MVPMKQSVLAALTMQNKNSVLTSSALNVNGLWSYHLLEVILVCIVHKPLRPFCLYACKVFCPAVFPCLSRHFFHPVHLQTVQFRF